MKRVWTADMTVIAQPKIWKGFENWRIAALISLATASHLRALVVLAVISLASFLPGFFQIPPVDRDEARFAQATKQMIETGDYVDIRFQEETRYKKPAGIYWLQAAAVEVAEAVGVPHATTNIAIYRLPSLIGAIGAVLMTYWAALAFVSRRAALLAGAMMATSILLGVEARLARTDDPDVRRVRRPRANGSGSFRAVVVAAKTRNRRPSRARAGDAMARRHPDSQRRYLLHRSNRRRYAGQSDRGSGNPRHAAGLLLLALLGNVLSRRHAGWPRGTGGVACTHRTWLQVSACLGPAVLDRIRTGANKAAPLRSAALPGARDPDCRGRGQPFAFAQSLVGARNDLVVHPDDGGGTAFDRAADRCRPEARPVDVVVRGCCCDLFTVRLAAL